MVEYMWHADMFDEHQWAMELLQDIGVPLSFVGLHGTDARLGEWRREVLSFIRPFAVLLSGCIIWIWMSAGCGHNF